MCAGGGGIFGGARHPVQAFEHAPAGGERRVDIHSPQEGVDRLHGVLSNHVAMAAFLIQTTEIGVMPFEALEGRQRLRDFSQVALAHGDQIQDIAVFRHLHGQRLGGVQALRILPALE